MILLGNEIHDSCFRSRLTVGLLSVLRNPFFTRLGQERLSIEGYKSFVREKYSSVAYFIRMLENAERLLRPVCPDLAESVRGNRDDKVGFFAGTVREAYRHEVWRVRSLELFGVSRSELSGLRLAGSKKHETIMRKLAASNDAFEAAGALLFLELFVVYEMKALLAAFERDLPEMFPPGGYSYDRFPNNAQEYWYGHALHDTWHFRSIEEPLVTVLGREPAQESLVPLLSGIERATDAKNSLYSLELFEAMAAASCEGANTRVEAS